MSDADDTTIGLMTAWTDLNAVDRYVDEDALRALVAPGFVFRLHTGGGDRTVDDFVAMLRQQGERGTEVRSTEARYRTFAGGGLLQDTAHVVLTPGAEPIELPRCFVFLIADGLITQIEEYVDPTPMRAA